MLDSLTQIKKLDTDNMLDSLQLLYRQIEEVVSVARELTIPTSYKKFDRIVVFGMGGSALGSQVIQSVYRKELKYPLEIINGYEMPGYVNSKTLVIGSSYSGTTEEVLTCVEQARQKKAKIVVISAGGALALFAKKYRYPALVFTTENNPCGSPRMGLGYSIVGQLMLFSQLGVLKISQKQIQEMVKAVAEYDTMYGVLTPEAENRAKQLARKTIDRSVWYVGGEHLLGNAHIAANQMNENAKRFAGYFALPELNHHLMEGMMYPKSNAKSVLFVMIESGLYHERVQKRYAITKKVLQKNSIPCETFVPQENQALLQSIETLVFFSYVSYYSALLKKIDPTAIPYVDFFKKEMGK
jgi:glucose/mannose-6-phosphate isomerase